MPRILLSAVASLAIFPVSALADAPPLRETIDRHIQAAWDREKLSPALPADDATFLRRVYLDLCGVIPTHEEAAVFLGDAADDKREKLVDRLLADPHYARHQADVWDLVMFTRRPPGYDVDRRPGFQRWLESQFAENVPYDAWVRTLLKAEGNTFDQGAPTFHAMYRSRPEDETEAVTQLFLGVQLQCARCHDHPYEKWTQLDFYGMAAFFARLQVVSVGRQDNYTKYAIAEKSTGDILFTGPASQQQAGKKGDPVKPKFLLGDPLDEPPLPDGFKETKFEDNKEPPKPVFSRKDQLAEWIARADNPFFARAVANRVWAQYMGRGLVHPVDNMSPSNEPSHPELLDALTQALVERKFDLKWYIREICLSRAYQLASTGATGEPMPQWYEHARVRPLSAEELAESWRIAMGYDLYEKAANKKNEGRFAPLTRDYVVNFFGTPNTGTGDFQGGLNEHLYLNNGQLGSLFVSGEGTLLNAMKGSDSWDDRVERLFLSFLARRPLPEERQKFVEALSADPKSDERLRDAIWALMTCSEFRFVH